MDNNTWKIQGTLGEYEIYHQDGQYFIRYRDGKIKNGMFLPLISERDPLKEAQRILGSFKLKKGLLAIVLGVSGLKVIEELKRERNLSGGEILIFEADAKLYIEIKKLLPQIFEDLSVFVAGEEDKLKEYVGELPIEGLLGYRLLPNARSFQLARDYYSKQETIFKSVFSSRFSDLLTRIEFEGKWILNSFLNLDAFLDALPVKSLFGTGDYENALLVSSGPSLRESLNWIKENHDRYFIACVDSAYRVLHRSGITPHLIFSLDSQIYTYRHFQGLPRGDKKSFPVLYADMVANPWVLRNWKGKIIMGVTAHYSDTHRVITPGCDFIEEEFLKEPCGDIQSGGSVATSLFDLLRNMNFQGITLVGQDLAFTNREIHCTGTHHTDIWISKNINRLESFENINFKIIKKRHIVWSVSKKGNPLPEDYIFSIYRKWFEEAIITVPLRVMNASTDGAIINGVRDLQIPSKRISEKFWRKLSGLVFKEPATIIKNQNLKNFYNSILNGNPFKNDELSEQFGFLERIGKKYFIKHLRTQLRNPDYNDVLAKSFLILQRKERLIFWNFLKKRISATMSKLN